MVRSSIRGVVGAGVSVLLLVGMAGVAAGQEAGPDPVLRGPRVQDNSAPGERSTFSGGRPRGREAQRPIPQPVFMKAVMSLNAEGAPEETRLSDAQAAQLKSIEAEFRASQREFIQAHREEIRALAQKLPPEDRARVREFMATGMGREGALNQAKKAPVKRPGKDAAGKGAPGKDRPARPPQGPADEMMGPEMADTPREKLDKPAGQRPSEAEVQEARAQLREFFERAPKPEQSRAKMWAVLSEPQRKLVEAELVKFRAQAVAKAEGPGKPKQLDGQDKPDKINLDDPRIPERARERLKNLPPEQREEAIKRLLERRQEERGRGRPGGQKPPPPVDEVDIPSPDEPK